MSELWAGLRGTLIGKMMIEHGAPPADGCPIRFDELAKVQLEGARCEGTESRSLTLVVVAFQL